METMEKPFRFRWSLLIVLTVWVLLVVCYEAGMVVWRDFTFVQTFIGPAVLMVALAPLSTKSLASSRWAMPCMAVWAGVMIPVVYLGGRWITGFRHHCDWLFLIGGITAFSAILLLWAKDAFRHRKLGA